jgi:hypothetical protein
MAGRINGYAVAGLGAGLVLFWSGFTGKSALATVQSVIKGRGPQGNPAVNSPQDPQGATGASPSGIAYPGYTGGGTPAENQALAKLAAAHFGWDSGAEWDALVALWDRESGWSNTADTRKTGLDPAGASVFAYGIAQARPYSKMPKSAWPPDKGGSASAADQVVWGLNYIKDTYGDPVAAEAHENRNGWY